MAAQPTFGGGERHVLDLAVGLRNRGLEVDVLSAGVGELEQRCQGEGLTVHRLNRPRRARRFPAALVKLVSLVQTQRYDILHGHSGYPNLMVRLASKITGVPAVVTWHGLHFLHAGGRAKKAMNRQAERRLASWSSAHIAVSETDAELLVDCKIVARESIRVVYNGVSISPEPPQCGPPLKLIAVARLHPQKDYDTLLDALCILRSENLPVRIDAFGFGPDEAKIRARIASLGLSDIVTLKHLPHAQLLRRYSSYGIFVLSTHWEGLPYAVLEAISNGLPVVATDVGAMHEVIRSGKTGELVAPKDAKSLALAIQNVVNRHERYRCGIREDFERLRRNFSLDSMVALTDDVYASVLANKR